MRQRSKIAESAISVILQETSLRLNIFVVVVWLKKCELISTICATLERNVRLKTVSVESTGDTFVHELKWPFRLRQKSCPPFHAQFLITPLLPGRIAKSVSKNEHNVPKGMESPQMEKKAQLKTA